MSLMLIVYVNYHVMIACAGQAGSCQDGPRKGPRLDPARDQ